MSPIPTQVSFHGLAHSDDLESTIRERVAWLEQFYAGLMRCRVRVTRPDHHQHAGQHCHVRIELTVPGGPPLVVNHEPTLHPGLKDLEQPARHKDSDIESSHRDAAIAVHDAFDAARRQLEDFARLQRGAVKTHQAPGPR